MGSGNTRGQVGDQLQISGWVDRNFHKSVFLISMDKDSVCNRTQFSSTQGTTSGSSPAGVSPVTRHFKFVTLCSAMCNVQCLSDGIDIEWRPTCGSRK